MLPPEIYGNLLLEKIKEYKCNVYLINTGLNGKGERYSISETREYIYKIMDGSILNLVMEKDELFGFYYPKEISPKKYWREEKEFYIKQLELKKKLSFK